MLDSGVNRFQFDMRGKRAFWTPVQMMGEKVLCVSDDRELALFDSGIVFRNILLWNFSLRLPKPSGVNVSSVRYEDDGRQLRHTVEG